VYLHHVFDLWAQWWRRRHAHGDVIIVRFADDVVVGFEYQADAQRFLTDLRERFAKFGLDLHPDKTRLIEFGRHAVGRRAARGLGKPETFDFLASRCTTRLRIPTICGHGISGYLTRSSSDTRAAASPIICTRCTRASCTISSRSNRVLPNAA